MARTQEEISTDYAQTLARAGEKTYLIHVKSEEIETLSQEREKLLNHAKNISREAWAAQQRAADTTATQAQDAVETPETTTTTETAQ